MEFANFLRVLLRYKKTLLIIPLITMVAAFFLLRNMANTYRSTSRIATGIVERSDEFITKNVMMESKITQEFSNIIQMMLLKKVVNQVSYQLMIHDLLRKETPYRKQSSLVNNLTDDERKRAIATLTQKYNRQEELSLFDKDQNFYNKLLISQKYDYESLTKKLNVYRLQTSDYIYLDFESENPILSAYVLNMLSKESIAYYTNSVNQKKDATINFLDSSLKAKEVTLQGRMNAYKAFKIKHKILDVNNQANVLMGQIADYESKRQEAVKNISAYSSILNDIDAKLDPNDKKNLENSVTKSNMEILTTRNRLSTLNDEYIKNNFDPKYKVRIDSLTGVLTNHINDANDRTTYNTSSAKQDLVKERLNTEINLEIAKNSVSSLNSMVNNLNGQLSVLAPNQANMQEYETQIQNDTKEYLELQNRFNQTKLESSFPVKLRQVEAAMPEAPEPSKKIIMLGLAGVVSFMFTVVVLFIMYYVDNTVNDVQELADSTQQPVIGTLSLIRGATLEPDALWDKSNDTPVLKQFKSQLRSIRFEIDNDLGESKILAITSLDNSEGKTFLALNLAYAYKMINKKVLLIDGNFDHSNLREIVEPDLYLEDFLLSKQNTRAIYELEKKFVVMANKGEDVSLLELSNPVNIQAKLQALREQFDIILIEIPSLAQFNKAREWVSFSDKVVPVFAAGQNITSGKKKEIEYLSSIHQKLAGWVMNKVVSKKDTEEKLKAVKKTYA